MSATACPPTAALPRTRARSLFLPKEHGSWSLTLEPVALGLLVAPSLGAGGLALVATSLFLARRPVKLALDLDAPAARRLPAAGTVALFGALATAGFALAVQPGGFTALWPLAFALPFAGMFALFDAQGLGRTAFAEIAGATAYAAIPAACATLAGWSSPAALALGSLVLLRSVPAVVLVRGCLRRRKYDDTLAARLGVFLAAAALIAVMPLALTHAVPPLAAVAVALLFFRSLWFVTPAARTWSAKRLGLTEAVIGIGYLGLLALAYARLR